MERKECLRKLLNEKLSDTLCQFFFGSTAVLGLLIVEV